MNRIQKLSKFLHLRRAQISQERGYPPDEFIPWPELAAECDGIPTSNLYRWKDGKPGTGMPSYEYVLKMALVFGDGIFEACGYPQPLPVGIDPKWLEYIRKAQDNPDIASVMEQAIIQAEARLKTDQNVSKLTVTVT